MLKPKPKREYKPIDIKLPEKLIPNNDDEKYLKAYQQKLLKAQEDVPQNTIEEQRRLKEKDK